ncbi:hypothetical protein B0H16DRAFT_1890364 [Mycena metata]|uniref:Uncharacterized protein n=1 Tax=Mycena metata TaxID=1033252 RepID=A0AAD7IGV3_9AGAR|nr:hypothetical protein B0H16DRAFT_1890364 [Mycena metata]
MRSRRRPARAQHSKFQWANPSAGKVKLPHWTPASPSYFAIYCADTTHPDFTYAYKPAAAPRARAHPIMPPHTHAVEPRRRVYHSPTQRDTGGWRDWGHRGQLLTPPDDTPSLSSSDIRHSPFVFIHHPRASDSALPLSSTSLAPSSKSSTSTAQPQNPQRQKNPSHGPHSGSPSSLARGGRESPALMAVKTCEMMWFALARLGGGRRKSRKHRGCREEGEYPSALQLTAAPTFVSLKQKLFETTQVCDCVLSSCWISGEVLRRRVAAPYGRVDVSMRACGACARRYWTADALCVLRLRFGAQPFAFSSAVGSRHSAQMCSSHPASVSPPLRVAEVSHLWRRRWDDTARGWVRLVSAFGARRRGGGVDDPTALPARR